MAYHDHCKLLWRYKDGGGGHPDSITTTMQNTEVRFLGQVGFFLASGRPPEWAAGLPDPAEAPPPHHSSKGTSLWEPAMPLSMWCHPKLGHSLSPLGGLAQQRLPMVSLASQ